MPPKQKPNEACACGSGAKHKKCCFGKAEQAPASAGVPRPPVQNAEQAMCRKMAAQVAILSRDALDADAAGDFRKAFRKIEAALPFVAVVATSAASSHNTIRAMLSNFTFAIEYASRNGDLAGAENAAERALALLTAPYGAPLGVYPAALGTLSHAGWRDTPADPKEVRVQVNAAALAAVARDMMLSTVLGELGCARSRAYNVVPWARGRASVRGQPRSHRSGGRERGAVPARVRVLQQYREPVSAAAADGPRARVLRESQEAPRPG